MTSPGWKAAAWTGLLAAGLLGMPAAGRAAPKAALGRPAPAFTLADQDGHAVSLAALKGRVVVLEWTNPRCPVWRRHAEAGTMKTLAAKYAPRGVVWLGVNSTSDGTALDNRNARALYGLPYPILDDAAGSTGLAYGAKTTPHMFVIDAKGRLAYAGAIDSDRDGAGGPDVVNFVDRALAALLAGRKVAEPETTPYGCSVKYRK